MANEELEDGEKNIKTPEELKLEEVIGETEKRITKMTNSDPEVEATAKSGKASGLDSYKNIWDKNFNRINLQQWDDFIQQYPESFFYQDKNEDIKRAYERKERKN